MARRAIAVSAALLAASLAQPSAVRAADGCPEVWEGAAGPLPGGSGPADFGATPEACAQSDMSARVRGSLLVASSSPDFFGSLATALTLRARKAIGGSSWLSAAFDAITHRYVNNGGLASSAVSLGPPTVGYHRALFVSPSIATAVHIRALLPLDTARANSVATGVEIGGGLRAPLGPRTVIDGGLALVAPAEIGAGQVHAHFVPVGLIEAWVSPRPAIAFAAGARVETEAAPSPTLITVAPRVAMRAALRTRFWLGALVELPVLGRDRTDLVAALTVGYSP